MPYIYDDVESLDGRPVVGTHQCVALVEQYARTPRSVMWREGDPVRGNMLLRKGTAIATFVDGRYPNLAHGNHAALYVSQDAGGLWVVDQWRSSTKITISKRHIRFQGRDSNGRYINASDNGDAFSVIN